MHTSHSERRALRGIERELRSSAPGLFQLFGNFTLLASGEALPRTERLRAGVAGPRGRRARRRTRRRQIFFFTPCAVALAMACWALAIGSGSGAHRQGPAESTQHLTRADCAELSAWESYLEQPAPKPVPATAC